MKIAIDMGYMHTIRSEIIVDRDINHVLNIVNNVKNWEKLSANFKNIRVIIKDGNKYLTLQTEKNGKKIKRYSLRIFHKNRMEFIHFPTKFPISEHSGEWEYKEINENKSKIILIHNFHVPFLLIGEFLENIIGQYFFKKSVASLLIDFKEAIENWKEKE